MNCLSGIRIVDFTWVGAGAYISLLCSFLGAEVIKVESKQRLDVSRYILPKGMKPDINKSAMFNEMNLGKRSVSINLSKPEGVELIKKIISISDVVIENFRPGVMRKLGLDYPVLINIKPNIIMLSYSLSGQKGPESEYAGYAPISGAVSGLSYLLGYQTGPPCASGGEYDLITGAASVVPLLGALYNRNKTGKGDYIDFASREAGTSFIGEAILDYSMNNRNETRCGNRDAVMAPHNCYRCKGDDAWISIAIANDQEWDKFCHVTNNTNWLEDGRFSTAWQRWFNQEILDQFIQQWSIKYTDYDIMELLQRKGIAAMPVFDCEQLDNDIHVKERGIVNEIEHPSIGKIKVLGVPWILSDERPSVKPAPLFGEANHYVFHDLLNMDEAEMKEYEDKKIIY